MSENTAKKTAGVALQARPEWEPQGQARTLNQTTRAAQELLDGKAKGEPEPDSAHKWSSEKTQER